MYRLNAIFLLIVSILLGCSSLEDKVENKKAEYFEKGLKNFTEGNYDKARVELKNVLHIDPKDARAHYLYARIEEKREQYGAAFAHYSEALQINPEHRNAKFQVGKFHLLSGNPDKAMAMADSILASKPDDLDALILRVVAISQLEGGKKAIAEAKQVQKLYPEREDSALLLARLYQHEKENQRAVEILQSGLKIHPDSVLIRLMLAELYEQAKNYVEIERLFKELVQTHPDQLNFKLQLAGLYISQERDDEAQALLQTAIAQAPDDPQRKLYFIDFLLNRKGFEQAEKQLNAFIKEMPQVPELRLGLAMLYENADKITQAEEVYREIIQRNEQTLITLKAKSALAQLFFRENELEKSKSLVDEVLRLNPKAADALSISGKIALTEQDISTAITRFRSYLEEDPTSSEALLLLSKAHEMNNQPALALETLLRAASQQPQDIPTRLALIDYLQSRKEYRQALEQTDVILQQAPDHPEALIKKTALLMAAEDWERARVNAERVIQEHPQYPIPYLQVGQIYQLQEGYAQAIGAYEKAIQLAPDSLEPYAGLIRTYFAAGQSDKATAWLNKLLSKDQNHRFAHFLLGNIAEYQKQTEKAITLYKKAIQMNPDWVPPYHSLATVYMENGQYEKALEVYRNGLQKMPGDSFLSMAVVAVYEKAGAIDRAIEQYEGILKKEPHNAIAANNLAVLLSEKKGDRKSLKRALTMTQLLAASGEPAFMDTLGWIYYKLEQFEQAVPLLEKAVDKAPDSAELNYHLGMAYHKDNRNFLAAKHLKKALALEAEFEGAEEAKQIVTLLSGSS